jgi:hypothetical protein
MHENVFQMCIIKSDIINMLKVFILMGKGEFHFVQNMYYLKK